MTLRKCISFVLPTLCQKTTLCNSYYSLASNTCSKLSIVRAYSSDPKGTTPSDRMTERLRLKFPQATHINVEDVSGGCGSMYDIFVESVEFKGLSTVKQHRLINETLKEEIKEMHGLRIQTKVPKES